MDLIGEIRSLPYLVTGDHREYPVDARFPLFSVDKDYTLMTYSVIIAILESRGYEQIYDDKIFGPMRNWKNPSGELIATPDYILHGKVATEKYMADKEGLGEPPAVVRGGQSVDDSFSPEKSGSPKPAPTVVTTDDSSPRKPPGRKPPPKPAPTVEEMLDDFDQLLKSNPFDSDY